MAETVGVHGILNQQSGRHQMIAAWSRPLADGLERAIGHPVALPTIDAAFYGDLFLPGRPGAKGTRAPKVDFTEADAEDLGPLVDEVSAAQDDSCSADPLGETKARTRLPGPIIAMLRRLDRHFGSRTASLLFLGELKQVRRYLLDEQLKQQADARVSAAVEPGCRVLIGHSLGSVAAFEFLRQHPDHQLDLFLTLGSPLSLRTVRAMMPDPSLGADGLPPSIQRWVNLRDPHDPVTTGGGLKPFWPGVEDDDSVRNQSDAHAVERYLGKAQTGRPLLDALPHLGEPVDR